MGKKLSSARQQQPALGEQPSTVGDVAVVWGRNENGIYILRRRAQEAPVEAGLLQPLVEGRPINGEVISMRRRGDLPFLFDIKTEVTATGASEADTTSDGPPQAANHGPSQVATESYRRGWDAIWGSTSRNLN
jgi:hypothetical protein